MTNDLDKRAHSVTALLAHLVFVTKSRKKIFMNVSLKLLHSSMNDTALKMGFKILEFNGEADHIHRATRSA
jgi:putative transposase